MPNKSLSRSSLLSFQKYSSLLAGNEAYIPFTSDYDLLETEILTGTQASVTFSSLNSTYGADYQHLQIRAVFYRNGGSAFARYNGDSTSGNYRSHGLYGNGSSVYSEDFSYARDKGMIGGSMGLSTTIPFALVMDILDPFETTKYTTARVLSGRATGGSELISHVWMNTNALTQIELIGKADNFRQYSRFSLYGLKAA